MELPERLTLAHLPTPIQPLPRLSQEVEPELYVWRDDLTGFELGGNKVRKLEFLLAAALAEEADTVITCGGVHSNHVRATVFAARRLGLQAVVVQRQPPKSAQELDEWTGNPLLIRMAGAAIVPVEYAAFEAAGSVYAPFLEREAERLRAEGRRPYVIDEGGSSPRGTLGYVRAVDEMLDGWRDVAGTEAPDSLFLALGSGGTYAGLLLGFERRGLDSTRVHAVNVCDDREYFEKRVGRLLAQTGEQFGLPFSGAPLRIHDGFVGGGYGQASTAELQLYLRVARSEGLVVDPCYSGKALHGMLSELAARPADYGDKVLFLHSGGALADFAYSGALRGALLEAEGGSDSEVG